MIDILRKLINFQSYSGKERPILEYIKTLLEDAGIKSFFQKDNLVVKLTGIDQTRAFIFNGHVDVVDIGNISNWKYDPWGGKVNKDRIYGRGTSDMKGGVLALIETAKALTKTSTPPTDVWFTFVVREETDGKGTQQFAQWFKSEGYTHKYSDTASIFAEPTGLNTIHYGNRGNFFIRAKISGTAGHSSRPSDIKSHAIVEMSMFINDLERENDMWQKKFRDSEFTPPTITVTSIEAKSESPNRTPDYCQACFDLRTIPGYHQEAFDRVKKKAEKRRIKLSLIHPAAPFGYTKPDAKIVKAVQSITAKIKAGVNDASNDLGFFTNIGIDGVVFGPGDMSEAHRTDESADTNQINAAPEIYEKIYLSWADTKG